MTDRPWLNLRPCLMHVSLLLLQRHQADDMRWKWTINSIKIPERKIISYLKGLTAKQKLLQAQLWIRRCEGEEVYSHWLKLCCLNWIWRPFCALYHAKFSTSSHQWEQGRELEGPGCVHGHGCSFFKNSISPECLLYTTAPKQHRNQLTLITHFLLIP